MFLALEGFTLPSGYIIKELSVIFDDDNFQHFQFKAPPNFYPTTEEQRTIKFSTKYLNQLYLTDDSLLPYSTINEILKNLSFHTIYVAGHSAYNFIKAKLPMTHVIDICIKNNFKYPKQLSKSNCFKDHNPRYCSLSKCEYIKKFMINEWAMSQ